MRKAGLARLTRPGARRPLSLGRILRFCVLFLLLVATGHFLLELETVWRAVREPYCDWLARACGTVLSSLGVGAEAAGGQLSTSRFGVRIVRACDGLNAVAIFGAGVLSFPAAWRSRWIGLAWGLPVIFALNVVRIVVLFLIGTFSVSFFDMVHVYVFQVFLVAVAAGCFAFWAHAATVGQPAR